MPRLRLVPLCLTVVPLLLLGAAGTGRAAPARGWTYHIAVDADLTSATVTCDFSRYVPKLLVSDRKHTLSAFSFPEMPDGARLRVLGGGEGLEPTLPGAGRVLRYRVDLEALTRIEIHERPAFRVGRDLALQPGALLLRPARWPEGADVQVRFSLPAGFRVAAPWTPLDAPHAFALPALSTSLLGRFAIGRFPAHRFEAHGAEVDLAVMDAPLEATPAGLQAWIEAAMGAVANLFGRFPTPRLMVLVQPVPARWPPVPFGSAMRAGGGHVHLLVANAVRDASLPGEWVGVHEMTHLGMPWTYNSEAWLQEGFVTYYQEVLRARAGFLSEQQAWQNIDDGFDRGRLRGGAADLASESESMRRDHNFWRVYWAGAAMALHLDVELRRRSGGRFTLDHVLRQWHEQYGGTRGPFRGVDLMKVVDRRLGGPVCEQIAEACLTSREFPEVEDLYARLGLRLQGGRVVLDDDAPDAAIRRAIMTGEPAPVSEAPRAAGDAPR